MRYLAAQKARALWSDITPIARRDWIHWITSPSEPRRESVDQKCLLYARAGKLRVCCSTVRVLQ